MSDHSTPRVSVLLAVHNDARFLAETLESVLAQSYCDFELVVVDDASDDGSAAMLQALRDPRLRYFRNEQNLGQVPSLNRGLAQCRGDLVARIDGDDLCEPDRLTAQIHYLETHPALAGCATWTTEIDEDGRVIGGMEPCGDPDFVRWLLCHTSRLYHPTMMIRRDVLTTLGGYDESYPATEDYELWTRMVDAGYPLGVVPQRLVRYRRRSGSITDTNRERQRGVGLQIAARHVNEVLGAPRSPDVVEVMRTLLSWGRPDPDLRTPGRIRDALKLMYDLRRRILKDAARAARAAADEEVAGHLLRQGTFLLKDAPDVAAQLGRYVARLPGHRRQGLGLTLAAIRCVAGTARRRLLGRARTWS
jgi:glycosyltransferase involved in cell wall biosynthesis